MNAISLATKFCIVTGALATNWSGHVIARGYGPIRPDYLMPLRETAVIAGFADRKTHESAKSNDRGCFGEWQRSHGLILCPHFFSECIDIESLLEDRLMLIDRDLYRPTSQGVSAQ